MRTGYCLPSCDMRRHWSPAPLTWQGRFEAHNHPTNPHYSLAVRGATLFGQGLLQNAYINVQSANQRSGFPVSL